MCELKINYQCGNLKLILIINVRGHFFFNYVSPLTTFLNIWTAFFSVYMEEGKGMFICMLCLRFLVYLGPKQKLSNAIRSGEQKF